MKMKKTRWFEPYHPKQPGRSPKPAMAAEWDEKLSGVYFIRSKETGAVVYVGQSQSQLKKTIYRHFQEWQDKTRRALWGTSTRKSYSKYGYEVRFIVCSPDQATRLEKLYIGKHQPRDCNEKYKSFFGQSWEEVEKNPDFSEAIEWDEEVSKARAMPKAEYLDETPDWAK